MICENCKFAEWRRAASGRLHPSGEGRCTWQRTFRVAKTATVPGIFATLGEPIRAVGGDISRKRGEEEPTSCDVFQKRGQE